MVTSITLNNYLLGNSLFQLASLIATALDNKDIPGIPANYRYIPFLDIPKEWIITEVDRSKLFQYTETQFKYSPITYRAPHTNLYGYFQSEKYFVNHEKIIKQTFSIKSEIQQQLKDRVKLDFSGETISLHIRRGDYLNRDNLLIYPQPSIDYFTKAISLISSKSNISKFELVVFSNDINWCKNNLLILASNPNVNKLHFVENNKEYEDLFLMSQCKHNIIVNSSFSWWAAWLNHNINKCIVAPKQWFGNHPVYHYDSSDIIPERSNWYKL